jgi:hypothetical protein
METVCLSETLAPAVEFTRRETQNIMITLERKLADNNPRVFQVYARESSENIPPPQVTNFFIGLDDYKRVREGRMLRS